MSDGSHIDRKMNGKPYFAIPHKTGGKLARMYRAADVAEIASMRGCSESELFDRATIKSTQRKRTTAQTKQDKRAAQKSADIKALMLADDRSI